MKKENKKEKKSGYSRRSFIATSAAATAGLTILPSNVIAGLGHKAPSDKLNIAGVGIGNIPKDYSVNSRMRRSSGTGG